MTKLSPHWRAVWQALFVTFLWSTSFVLIKIGLEDIPPLTFAGLRYTLAFLCLLPPAILRPAHRAAVRALSRRDWGWLILLGVLYYTVTQGTQFVALDRLPSATVSLFLNFSAVAVAFLGIIWLAERLTGAQWGGVVLSLAGAAVYFYPVDVPAEQVIGIVAVTIGLLANAVSSILGRFVNRGGAIPPLIVTVISMGVGSALMLAGGLIVHGLPALSAASWLIIAALAVVNTAFAFTLWNLSLRTLSAIESNIINNTMLIQIAVLAWVFLREALTAQEIAGLGLAAVGTLIVQLRRRQARPATR